MTLFDQAARHARERAYWLAKAAGIRRGEFHVVSLMQALAIARQHERHIVRFANTALQPGAAQCAGNAP